MAMVTVYHGTTAEKAKNIFKEKTIRISLPDIARYPDTTPGYVYVTKRFCDAFDFASRPTTEGIVYKFVVFKIQIDEKELLSDNDEKIRGSTLSENGYIDCFRIRRDLALKKDVVSYKGFCVKSNAALGKLLDGLKYGDFSISEDQWISL